MRRSTSQPPILGVSISDPPPDELSALGLSSADVRGAFAAIVEHVLETGWSIAYGGDLRQGGFTRVLVDLVRDRGVASERVTSWLAWPIWVNPTASDDAALTDATTVVRCPGPAGAPETLPPRAERSPAERLLAADALRLMRQDMTAALGARVVIGGRVAGQSGLVPGVVEEAALAVVHQVPLFAAGGLGGAGRVVSEGLAAAAPVELSVGYQLAHTPGFGELFEHARSHGQAYDPLVALLLTGWDGLGNGLDEDENRRLAETHDLDEVVALVLRGLDRLSQRHEEVAER